MTFEDQFEQWLNSSLSPEIPGAVRAFAFNLFEPAGRTDVKFGIELIGAGAFDPDDEDWACEEIWEPAERQLHVPISYSGAEWEVCLHRVRAFLEAILEGDSPISRKLKSKQGVGIGFVDGNLELLWCLNRRDA